MHRVTESFKTRVDPRRVFAVRKGSPGRGPVIYWMSRDQRADDNWALLYAQDIALARGIPLLVIFALADGFLGAPLRHYDFMLHGLAETAATLAKRGIGFMLLEGDPAVTVPAAVHRQRAATLVTDFDPLRVKRQWKTAVAGAIDAPMFEVDTHNIVPCREASRKLEFAAYTLRPKIQRLLSDFLTPFPSLQSHPHPLQRLPAPIDWPGVRTRLGADPSVGPIDWLAPGAGAAAAALRKFVAARLTNYAEAARNPNGPATSDLSSYLHFGQLAPQRVALAVDVAGEVAPEARKAFLEQLIVRRELADNFCLYNDAYDRFEGFHAWAQTTLDAHRADPRDYRYGAHQLADANTHDDLWNAAQQQLAQRGKMHGYMRMYWAKKILEWTASPEEALAIAIALNDRYSLDGRDPNGYAGIAWSIGGVHDRAWAERPIFGKIRYMSYNGCRGKFSIRDYIAAVNAEFSIEFETALA